jgi:hypothetical protein
MNKRCIVNVATGEFYCKMQDRLKDSFFPCVDVIDTTSHAGGGHSAIWDKRAVNPKGIDLMLWRNVLPNGSRPHSESPYGFKVHAIKAAYERGYTSILWVDSPAYSVKEDISPIFDKIEKEGYYAMSHIDPLENWVGDTALSAVSHSVISRNDLMGKNLPSGSCYGFDMSSPIGMALQFSLVEFEKTGLFKSEVISDGKWHRHDEAILALLLMHFNKPVFTHDPLFQSDSPECVIKSGGEMKL